MMSGRRYRFILFILLLLPLSCTKEEVNENNPYTYQVPAQVDDGWATCSMEDAGMNPIPIYGLMNILLARDDHYYESILIVKDNRLVVEEYFSKGDRDRVNPEYFRNALHMQASVSKSVTSALFGIAFDRGLIPGVEEKMFTFFPEYSDLDVGDKGKITLRHLLSMSSGLAWDESSYSYGDTRNDTRQLFLQPDPIRFILSKPLEHEPGAGFIYNSGTTNVLGEIIRKRSGLSLEEFAEEYLFQPLGITDYYWEKISNDVTFASGGLRLRRRDMARIGQLYLQEGMWDGNRVISTEWIRESVRESIRLPGNMVGPYYGWGYGYQWWLETYPTGNTDSYSARGWGDQYIIVLPAVNMVVAVTGAAYHNNSPIIVYEIINDYILPSVL